MFQLCCSIFQLNAVSVFWVFSILIWALISLFQAAIWHCLNHYAYSDATFLAERLCAEGEISPGFCRHDVITIAILFILQSKIVACYWLCLFRCNNWSKISSYSHPASYSILVQPVLTQLMKWTCINRCLVGFNSLPATAQGHLCHLSNVFTNQVEFNSFNWFIKMAPSTSEASCTNPWILLHHIPTLRLPWQ